MKLFKVLVSFTVALLFVFFSAYAISSLIVLYSDCFDVLVRPKFLPNTSTYEWIWLLVHVLSLQCISASFFQKRIRKILRLWFLLFVLNLCWHLFFCFFHFVMLCFAFSFIECIILAYITFFYITNSKSLWVIMIPVFSWFAFTLVAVFFIIILN
jgi:tryptophan-rich sensory protein